MPRRIQMFCLRRSENKLKKSTTGHELVGEPHEQRALRVAREGRRAQPRAQEAEAPQLDRALHGRAHLARALLAVAVGRRAAPVLSS